MAERAERSSLIEIRDLSKRFPGVLALDRVSVDFRAGEVHAVVGENGAGKSTLMNVLAGELVPDAGEVRIDGRPAALVSPLASRAAGIAVVYQELSLCPTLSVADNIVMADIAAQPMLARLRRDWMRREARAALARLGITRLDPNARAGRLSIAEMQLVEIARAIRQRARGWCSTNRILRCRIGRASGSSIWSGSSRPTGSPSSTSPTI